MAADLEAFLADHAFLTAPEIGVLAAEHPGVEALDAAVRAGRISATVAGDIRELLASGRPQGLEPKLPGLLLLAEAGRGARGVVYRAWQRGLRRTVAVKVFQRGVLTDQKDRTRFVRESRIAARLEHPCLMRAYDIGSSGDNVYIVLEYIEGESLRDRLKRDVPLSLREALAICSSVAEGLAFIASQGIAHRDIKPANIQVTAAPRRTNGGASTGGGTGANESRGPAARILDLGLARPEGLSENTAPLVAAGTPACISPEQAAGEESITPKADVYALGTVLFRCVSGDWPFSGRNSMEMLQQHMRGSPPPLDSRAKGLPQGLSELVGRTLQKPPEERPDAAEVAEKLRAMLAELPADADKPMSYLPSRPVNGNGGVSSRSATATASSMPIHTPMQDVGSAKASSGSGSSRTVRLATEQIDSAAASLPGSAPAPRPPRLVRWLVPALVTAAISAGLFVWMRAADRERAEEERRRSEQELADRERRAEETAAAARAYAAAMKDLARAAAAEGAAGPEQGSFEDRLDRAVKENGRALENEKSGG